MRSIKTPKFFSDKKRQWGWLNPILLTRSILIVATSWMACPAANAYFGTLGQQVPRMIDAPGNTSGLGYYVYLPKNYVENTSVKFPLIIHLHGSGQAGNGTTTLPAVTFYGAGHNIAMGQQFPAIIVMPQRALNKPWDPNTVNSFLDFMLSEYKAIDTDRVYLMGISLGGGGIWNLAHQYSYRYAAAVTVSSYFTSTVVSWLPCNLTPVPKGSPILNGLPLWEFHSFDDTGKFNTMSVVSQYLATKLPTAGPVMNGYPNANGDPTQAALTDMTVLYSYTKDSYQWVTGNTTQDNSPDKQFRMTVFKHGGHGGAWGYPSPGNVYVPNGAYDNPDMWNWMFSHKLSERTSSPTPTPTPTPAPSPTPSPGSCIRVGWSKVTCNGVSRLIQGIHIQ